MFFGYSALKQNGLLLKKSPNKLFQRVIIAFLLMCIIASIQPYLLIGQPISMGFRIQRRFFFILCSYFSMSDMLQRGILKGEIIEDVIINLGIFEGLLFIFQTAVSGSVVFLHCEAGYRYSSARFYFDSGIVMFMTILSFYRLMKYRSFKYWFAIIVGFGYELFASKGRLELIAILFACIVILLLNRDNSRRKVLFFVAGIIGLLVIINTSMFQDALQAIDVYLGGQSTASYINTMSIRVNAHEFYRNKLAQSLQTMILGCGYPNINYAAAVSASGYSERMILEDNGIFAFVYVYGVLGAVAVGFLLFQSIKAAWAKYKYEKNTFYIGYIVFLCAIAYNITFWWWKAESTILLVFFLCRLNGKNIYENQRVNDIESIERI
jgi:hypothetical protein